MEYFRKFYLGVSSDRSFVLGGGGGADMVAIVRIGIYTSDIVIGAGIVYCA